MSGKASVHPEKETPLLSMEPVVRPPEIAASLNTGPGSPRLDKPFHGIASDETGFAPVRRSIHGRLRLLTKAAMVFRAANPKESKVIEIYHSTTAEASTWMIHPNSKFRRLWDITTACNVIYVVTMVPIMAGFSFKDWGHLDSMNSFVDFYFIADMVLTFRTGILANGEVVMDYREVAHHYFKTWFIIDVISNFPLSLFVKTTARKSIKIVKLQKLPKLLRIGRLLKYLREYAKYYNLALSLVALIIGLHIFACLWVALFNQCDYNLDGMSNCEGDMTNMYMQSMHGIVLMFLGISEGTSFSSISNLLNPATEATVEIYAVSTVVFLFGLMFSSLFFGNVLALLMSWDQQNAQFRNRMDIIAAEMRHYELPEELQHRVRRNYDYLWINQRAYSDMMLLNQPGISKTLRTTIALHLYKDLVRTVPFFAGSDTRFLGKVCLALETAVYLPGDTIIYMDDVGKEMFIVRKGLVEILIPDAENAEKRIYLRDGNFFGETALVIDVRRTNTVKAVSICDLNMLSKKSFNEIVAEYPEFGERMKRTVIKRQLDNMNIQSPVEKMKLQNQLSMVVEKSLQQRRMSVSLRTIYRAKKLGDKLKEIADRAARANQAAGRRVSRGLMSERGSGRSSFTSPSDKPRAPTAAITPAAAAQPPPTSRKFIRKQSSSDAPLLRQHGFERPPAPDPTASPSPMLPPLATDESSKSLLAKSSSQIDIVSRKLSKTEMTMNILPAALTEITSMVNQIKRTTEKLNRRLQLVSECSSDDDDFDFGEELDNLCVGVDGESLLKNGLGAITTLTEETEDEIARRESRSTFSPPDHVNLEIQANNATAPK